MNTTRLIVVLLLPIIGGCATNSRAPVEDRSSGSVAARIVVPAASVATDSRVEYHTVKKGETLYSIALDKGLDYKDVAAWNNLDDPTRLRIGQQLRITPPENGSVAVAKPVIATAPVQIKPIAQTGISANTEALKREPKGGKLAYSDEALAKARQGDAAEKPAEAKPEIRSAEPIPAEKPVVASDDLDWMWPTNGKAIAPYAEGGGKGIDIAGKAGDPVLAAASGVVSYAGAGLRGYGNLIVLRHNATYLSVYAHNSKLLVKEKDTVTRGQKIAEMGSTDAESPRLHFEIRRQGKPTDPQKLLPAR